MVVPPKQTGSNPSYSIQTSKSISLFSLVHKIPQTRSDSRTSKAFHYQEGLTFAFLIDFIGDNRIQRRVYIQTTSTGFPMGSFPKSILKEHPIDVALLSMDSANIAMNNKYSILDFLNPNITFFCHYENFFSPKRQRTKGNRKSKPPKKQRLF